MSRRILRTTLVTSAAVLMVVTLSPPAALAADPLAPSIVKYRNASDPHIDGCHVREKDPATGAVVEKAYLCVYTSSDMTTVNSVVDGNYYPMNSTYVYTLDVTNGFTSSPDNNPGNPNSWSDRAAAAQGQPAFTEWQLPATSRNNHLWAPTMHYGDATHETYLYVPDENSSITTPGLSGNGHPSYIAVATSYWGSGPNVWENKPWGPFTYKKNITYRRADIPGTVYMSDPAVTTLAGTHPPNPDGTNLPSATWLLWANGDWNDTTHSNCGDLSIGRLDDDDFTDLVDDPDRASSHIVINGIANAGFGVCAGTDHPYLEGPELYDLRNANLPVPCNLAPTSCNDPSKNPISQPFALMFALKPEDNRNQVLAWASASDPKGPYTFRGVLMDPSANSWTNHGSVYLYTRINASTGQAEPVFILFFHDDLGNNGTPPHNRQARATCLTYDRFARTFVKATRPTGPPGTYPNLKNCVGTVDLH